MLPLIKEYSRSTKPDHFFYSELEKITSELGAEKEGHAATLSGSQSLTAELEAERANLAVQVNELSALKEQHTGW